MATLENNENIVDETLDTTVTEENIESTIPTEPIEGEDTELDNTGDENETPSEKPEEPELPAAPENNGNEVIVIEPEHVEPDPCTYIKRGIGVVEYDFRLDPESYHVGYTYEDYMDNAWTLLTEEHIAFRKEHPSCSPLEMFNLEMNPVYEPTEEELIARARSNKLNQINHYDTSTNVNSFYLNGAQVWLDKSMRVGLMNSMEIEKAAGREVSTVWFGDVCYTLPIAIAIQMLQALELYALACYNKTAEHKVAVQLLETRKEIEDYDYTIGYPEKLVFDTTNF